MRRAIEPLESRTLLSVTSLFDPAVGELSIDSDAAADTIEVSIDAATNEVLVNDLTVDDTAGGTVTADELESVMIDAGPGNDVVDLSALDPITFPDLVDTEVVITSGDGADVITGSGMDDVIQGDAGNDTINASSMTESVTLFGGHGADKLIGGNNNDKLRGQGGSLDTLTGGPGNDTLDGGSGYDQVTESKDSDFTASNTELVGAGTDTLNDIQVLSLTGGASNNTFDGSAFTGRGVE